MISTYIRSVESEYEKANQHWLDIHIFISACLAAVSFLLEVILFFILDEMSMINTTAAIYMRRYVFIPTGLNIFILLIIFFIRRTYPRRFTLQASAVSIGLVGICFVLFTIHSIFPSLYFLFAIPLMFSCIYGNYLLTSVTAVCVFAARIVGDVVITWDSYTTLLPDTGYDTVNFVLSLLILAGFYISCMALIYFEKERRLAAVKKETDRIRFRQGLIVDQLTSLYNRTALSEVLAHLSQEDTGLICAIMDIDHFREVNDILGHLAGDEYLKKISDLLRTVCGQHLLFRYGGDEFCILFAGISEEEARGLCRRVSRESAKILDSGSLSHAVAVSFGLSIYDGRQSSDDLIKTAWEKMNQNRSPADTY